MADTIVRTHPLPVGAAAAPTTRLVHPAAGRRRRGKRGSGCGAKKHNRDEAKLPCEPACQNRRHGQATYI